MLHCLLPAFLIFAIITLDADLLDLQMLSAEAFCLPAVAPAVNLVHLALATSTSHCVPQLLKHVE